MIVDFPELQRISGLRSKAAVRKYLKGKGIPFEVGASGAPWTTTEALNRVLLSAEGPSQPNFDACGPRDRHRSRA
jgi:hypothetical protein